MHLHFDVGDTAALADRIAVQVELSPAGEEPGDQVKEEEQECTTSDEAALAKTGGVEHDVGGVPS